MSDQNELLAAIAGSTVTGGGLVVGWWRRRQRKRQIKARLTAERLFPHARPDKLDREVTNILRHRKIK